MRIRVGTLAELQTEGRLLAQQAGYGRGWQRFWAENGLLVRDGNTLSLTKKGEKNSEGADKAGIEYRVTDKTNWSKGGKPAAASDFKAGDRAFVVPRLLPSGGVMALLVVGAS